MEIAVKTTMRPGLSGDAAELLRTQAAACRKFYEKYFDDRGFLICTERWGALDGLTTPSRTSGTGPVLHSLEPPTMSCTVQEGVGGHLRQYTLAKTTRRGVRPRRHVLQEFHTKMDWIHIGEGLVLEQQALSDRKTSSPRRMRRFAGFLHERGPWRTHYDPEHKIIRSLFNGSRSAAADAKPEDGAGDPIEIEEPLPAAPQQKNYQLIAGALRRLHHIVGDHP